MSDGDRWLEDLAGTDRPPSDEETRALRSVLRGYASSAGSADQGHTEWQLALLHERLARESPVARRGVRDRPRLMAVAAALAAAVAGMTLIYLPESTPPYVSETFHDYPRFRGDAGTATALTADDPRSTGHEMLHLLADHDVPYRATFTDDRVFILEIVIPRDGLPAPVREHLAGLGARAGETGSLEIRISGSGDK